MAQKLRVQLMAAALSLALAGCGGKAPDPAKPEPTAQEKLVELETSGAIPQLERLPMIEGIDINGDGVRDDIEQYIEQKYNDSAQRKAAMQTARVYQQMLLVDVRDAMALDGAIEASARAVNCARNVFAGPEGFEQRYRMSRELEAMTSNTKERLQAYLAFNRAASGTTSRLPKGETCD